MLLRIFVKHAFLALTAGARNGRKRRGCGTHVTVTRYTRDRAGDTPSKLEAMEVQHACMHVQGSGAMPPANTSTPRCDGASLSSMHERMRDRHAHALRWSWNHKHFTPPRADTSALGPAPLEAHSQNAPESSSTELLRALGTQTPGSPCSMLYYTWPLPPIKDRVRWPSEPSCCFLHSACCAWQQPPPLGWGNTIIPS